MEQSIEITFAQGLPGFENLRQFNLSRAFEGTELYYLHSIEKTDICFLCLNPFQYTKDYEFVLPETIQERLEIKGLEEVAVFNIVNINGGLEKATVNLQAPVIINMALGKGAQVVLNDAAFNIQEPLKTLLQGMVTK